MKEDFISELRQFFENKKVTQKSIANSLDVSPAYINKLLTGQKAFGKKTAQQFQDLFGLSASWLLTGEGSMLKTEVLPAKNGEGVPFYDQDFACGFLDFPDVAERPTEYVNLPGTRGATCWCRATGDSMQPLINNGDYVCLMKIYDPTFLVFGDTYAFDCENGMRTIKKLGRGTQPDTYRLIPVNKAIDEQDIPVSIIRSIFRVVAVAKYL